MTDVAAAVCKTNVEATPLYFAVSPLKLTVMFFGTVGLYQVYWFYKNWRLVKEREQSNILPALRSLFSYFFCYSLFSRIRTTAEEKHLDVSLPAGVLTLLWVITNLLGNLPDPYWLITFTSIIFLAPAQIAANRINAQVAPGHDGNASFSMGNIITIIIGGLISTAAIISAFIPPQ